MTREEFLFDISDLPQDGYRTLHKVLSDHDAEQRQIIDEQVEENRGLRSDVLLMQKEDASQRALIEQQAKEIARLTGIVHLLTTGECGSFIKTRFPFTFQQALKEEHP